MVNVSPGSREVERTRPVSDVSARGVTTGAHGPDLGNFTIFKESLEIQIFM